MDNKTLGSVSVCGVTDVGEKICSAGGRISTLPGNALQILEKSNDPEKNSKLIGKVTASGHLSVTEHMFFNLCFCDVSVLVEQFMIEFRLASFTVKSRRYVNFSDAGYFVPEFKNKESKKIFSKNADSLFEAYDKLLEAGIQKEDARFVLPYCFRSNFLCSMNARELTNVLNAMLYGRGSKYPEIYELGLQLAEKAKELAPGIFSRIPDKKVDIHDEIDLSSITGHTAGNLKQEKPVELLSFTSNPQRVTAKAALINNTALSTEMIDYILEDNNKTAEILDKIVHTSRARELEHISFTFRLSDLSLASITHLVRHRIQSINIPNLKTCNKSKYIIPPEVEKNPEALRIYKKAFDDNIKCCQKLKELGESAETLAYLSLAGNTLDVVSTMNARQLMLFLRLRTCNRAQWEIREYAKEMLKQLRSAAPLIFNHYGPTCFCTGKCPEGKLTCGKANEMKEEYKNL